jgi:hypothetical protein
VRVGGWWVRDTDIPGFFATLDPGQRLRRVPPRVSDRRVLPRIRQGLTGGVVEAGRGPAPSTGTPQGGVLSPRLATLAVPVLDRGWEERSAGGGRLARAASDVVVVCRTRPQATEAREIMGRLLAWLQLTRPPDKTRVGGRGEAGGAVRGVQFHQKPSPRTRRLAPYAWPRGKALRGGACQEPATACAVPSARGPGGTGAGPESGAPRRADLGPRGPLHEAACCPGPGRLASAVALPPDTSGTARPSAPRGIGGVDWSASTPPDGVPYSRACRAMKVVGKPSAGTPPVRVEGAEGGHQDCGPRRHSLTLPADGPQRARR